jgi:hypothetical protein
MEVARPVVVVAAAAAAGAVDAEDEAMNSLQVPAEAMPTMKFHRNDPVRRLVASLVLAVPLLAGAADQRTFATPEAAADALAVALKTNDVPGLRAIFGDRYQAVVDSGDAAQDAAQRADVAAALERYRMLDDRGVDKRVLLIGTRAWPFAIPVVREGGSWRFATEQGIEELLNRRIGANERWAIHVMNAYVGAQGQYAARDRNGDGVRQFAAKLASSPGKHDGLYWPADTAKSEEESPFGPLIAESGVDPASRKRGDPYRGYHYRILTAQGKAAAGGAYSYVINGRMIAGFGLVAWPHEYGRSGVMTFIVNHNGKVFQRNLGPNSDAVASKMTAFDPGAGWTEVGPDELQAKK